MTKDEIQKYVEQCDISDAVFVSKNEVLAKLLQYGFTSPDMTVREFVADELAAVEISQVNIQPSTTLDKYEALKDLLYEQNVRCDEGIEDLADDIIYLMKSEDTAPRYVDVNQVLSVLSKASIGGYVTEQIRKIPTVRRKSQNLTPQLVKDGDYGSYYRVVVCGKEFRIPCLEDGTILEDLEFLPRI